MTVREKAKGSKVYQAMEAELQGKAREGQGSKEKGRSEFGKERGSWLSRLNSM